MYDIAVLQINNVGDKAVFVRPIGQFRCDTSERATSRVRDARIPNLFHISTPGCELFAVMLWVDDVRNFGRPSPYVYLN